ncbi:hypothetical protein GW7_12543 [Heterocephalus glaber]|uniref:Uncharacterized protein n=1 Tax=Heterocephalus glaber TaxID=10181 RepID=G5AR61_HETGA|nr:hypothetical protein GW7_12543 [Heterocephalus glaber]
MMKETAFEGFLITRFLSRAGIQCDCPRLACTLLTLKLLILGLELLILRGQINGVLQDTSQEAAKMVLSGCGFLLPQPLPGLEYLCPDSQMPVSPPTLTPAQDLPSVPPDLQHVARLSEGGLHMQVIEGCQVLLCSVLLCVQGLHLEPQHSLLSEPSLSLFTKLQR